jgi:hypothetical protein
MVAAVQAATTAGTAAVVPAGGKAGMAVRVRGPVINRADHRVAAEAGAAVVRVPAGVVILAAAEAVEADRPRVVRAAAISVRTAISETAAMAVRAAGIAKV